MKIDIENFWNTVEQTDKDALHDVMYEANGTQPSDEEIKSLFMRLPSLIIGEAMSWGLSDTVVRDNIYEFIQSESE